MHRSLIQVLPERIGLLPQELRRHLIGVATQTVTVLGDECEYLIISRELEPAPQFFASCIASRTLPPFISDEVPVEYRDYVMAHEIYEGYYLHGRMNRCLRALDFELSRVPPDLLRGYLDFRSRSFTALAVFMEEHLDVEGGYTDVQLQDTRDALRYVDQLLS